MTPILLIATMALLACAFHPHRAIAQESALTLEGIWRDGAFRTESVQGHRSMEDGKHFSAIHDGKDGRSIVKYAYASGDSVSAIAHAKDIRFKGVAFKPETYALNADERKVLIGTDESALYRHSSAYRYLVLDRVTKEMTPVADGRHVFHADFSPDGSRVAYVMDNNLVVQDLATGKATRITSNGKENEVINGMADWVYEEEFAFTKAFHWSPDGKRIAWYEFTEAHVKEFSMTVYERQLYPQEHRFKYPKAGEQNATVRILISEIGTGSPVEVRLGGGDIYVPRIQWTRDANTLSVQRMNRHQNRLDLLFADAMTGNVHTVLTEESRTYIDVHDHLTFLTNGTEFIWSSERDGFNHLYLCGTDGKVRMQLTSGPFEVTKFYGIDAKGKHILYQSNEEGPSQHHVYSASLDGKWKRKLTPAKGHNDADFSKGMRYFINTWSDADTPPVTTLHDEKGKQLRVLRDNRALREKLAAMGLPRKEFFSFTPAHGTSLNAWVLKPRTLEPGRRYPVLLHIYGGPGSQYVSDSWGGAYLMWHHLLVQEGYIVVSVDNRGTGGRGRDFKHTTYMELGKLELEDYMETARHLATLPYVDGSRIGMFGWSYGGYMSSLAVTKGADLFKAGIAVAPVTNWRFYDTIYTERYMRTPQENPDGYDLNSPVHHADKLRGGYLLAHGTADDNVHFQNAIEMIEALIAANKQFDLHIYPDRNHAVGGGNARLHLFTKMSRFLKENL